MKLLAPLDLVVVPTLPTAGTAGRLVTLASDGKVYYDNGTAWVDLSATSASGGGSGQAVVDFGTFPGSNEAQVSIEGQPSILSTSVAMASLLPGVYNMFHSESDHAYAAAFMGLTCSVPTAGSGFLIQARSEHKLEGPFNISWSWR